MSKDNLITIQFDPKDLVTMAMDAKELIFNPEAEDAVIKLLELQEMVDNTVQLVKQSIAQQGLEYNPNFSSVVGDRLKANYSYAGSKYGFNPSDVKRKDPRYFKKRVVYSLDSKAVEKYEMAHKGRLPKGVVKKARSKNLNFRLTGGGDDE